jgi:hypothetical protein
MNVICVDYYDGELLPLCMLNEFLGKQIYPQISRQRLAANEPIVYFWISFHKHNLMALWDT